MTALQDIHRAVEECKIKRLLTPVFKRKTLVIRVGESAMRAIESETKDQQMPALIGGIKVVLTSAYPGWEIEEIG